MSAVVHRLESKPNMIRKPIHMPPDLIKKIEDIAKIRKDSFAAVVRDAAYAYDPSSLDTDEAVLVSMLEIMAKSNKETIKKIEDLERRLDETHKMLSEVQ